MTIKRKGNTMAIFWYIFISYISIFIHELGHYCSAYLFGIKATDVITGMGFKLFSFSTKHTTFTFKIIPGGGVTIYSSSEDLNLSTFQQFIILGSGVTFNYLTAVIATAIYFETSLVRGFFAFNQMIVSFIYTLFRLFSLSDFIAPQIGLADSIEWVAGQFTMIKFILFIFIFMNLLLFLFNLLPVPFFDGGQMLSLFIDPILYKIGIKENQLNKFKERLNQLVGILLIILVSIPIINEITSYFKNTPFSSKSIIRWILIILGAVLIKRLFTSILHHFKLNK